VLAVQPTVEMAKRNSRQRIDTLIDESPILRQLVKPARSRDAGNTMLSKDFPGGVLVMTGANSAVGLRSMPARYLFLDEVDAYPRLPQARQGLSNACAPSLPNWRPSVLRQPDWASRSMPPRPWPRA
jgi:phage terminase large subunit GpA-like protein